MGGNKFFFEEDVDSNSATGVTDEEQANIFGAIVSDIGISSEIESMAPMEIEPIKMKMQTRKTSILLLEYGIVGDDYVIHITPTHPTRNLATDRKLHEAIKETIFCLNKVVPFDLKVDIHLPQQDWEVKITSYLVRGGANAWNLSIDDLENKAIPEIEAKIIGICSKI